MYIRPAVSSDTNTIADIWNSVIRNSIATFTNVEKSVSDLCELIHEKHQENHGFYVAEIDGHILGFATYGHFRNGPGYAHTMEHSVFLSSQAKRKGIGKALIQQLESHAQNAGLHSLIAGLSGENTDGIAFHTNLGFTQVAHIKQAGFKFGRWHDLILMQKLM